MRKIIKSLIMTLFPADNSRVGQVKRAYQEHVRSCTSLCTNPHSPKDCPAGEILAWRIQCAQRDAERDARDIARLP